MSSEKKSEPSKEGFLNRWSQRKRHATNANDVEDTVATQENGSDNVSADSLAANGVAPGTLASESLNTEQSLAADSANNLTDIQSGEEQPLTDADMPDIDTLNGESDFSPFFSDGVSKELRNRALKKLFFSGKFAARDGLDDYDDDFTYFEPLGDTVTSDMKYHARRKEKARLAQLEEEKLEAERLEAEQAEAEKLAADGSDQESLPDQIDESSGSEETDGSEEAIAKDSQSDVNTYADVAENSESDDVASTTVLPKNTDDTQPG